MAKQCLVCGSKTEASANYKGDACSLLISAYVLAGLAMMLNIRLSYSSAPYALIRFRLPENLFSVFVRRMASALELWCLPSMLLGNIVDLFQKLFDGGAELRPIKVNATEIQSKAETLKSTAGTQSGQEITKTRDTDIKDDSVPGGQLKEKAEELRNKAELLSNAAQKLESAATSGPSSSTLATLETPARELKEAAKKDHNSGTDGLYKKAQALASGDSGLVAKSEEVITKFEEVERLYKTLMNVYKLVKNLTAEQQQLVEAVETTYTELKTIYDGMLNLTKLKIKAGKLKSTAESPSNSELTKLENKPSELATNAQQLSTAADELKNDEHLQGQVTRLKEAAKKDDPDSDSLHKKATELQTSPQTYENAKAVIAQFDTVKHAFDELIKVAIERSKLFDPKVQSVISKFNDLKNHYDGMMPFTKIKYYSDKIETEATTLRNTGSEAVTIVKYFESMETAYNKLGADNSVKEKFEALKNVYDRILNVNKMKQPATNLASVADTLKGNATVPYAKLFKDKYDKFGKIYGAIPDQPAKDAVQIYWTELKNVIDGEMKWWKFYWIIAPSIFTQWLNFLTYVALLVVYLIGGDQGHLTTFYFVIAISGVVFGINMTLLYAVDFYYIPVYIVGENTFPMLTSFIHYLSTLMFGNRRKWNSDFLLVKIDIWVAIIISFVAAVVWTVGYLCELDSGGKYHDMKHIHAFGFGGDPYWEQISPFLMIVVGMGLVYAIYPGIAPGMIVPFYLIDKIEMVLLIATIFPPVIVAMLRRYKPSWSPQHNIGGPFGGWKTHEKPSWDGGGGTVHAWIWHFFDLLMVTKIVLAAIFIYSLHYRDSNISRSIINQPKMSTFLSILFYMCHECLLALGFSGFIGNNGGDLILVPQYIGALFMIFLAFYSEGYIIEYKSHDPVHWPTEEMTKWNAFCYWTKRASKITNHNLRSLFTTDL